MLSEQRISRRSSSVGHLLNGSLTALIMAAIHLQRPAVKDLETVAGPGFTFTSRALFLLPVRLRGSTKMLLCGGFPGSAECC